MAERSLAERYDGFVCDLDGVVYAGPVAIPHAIASLRAVREQGSPIVYATNNGSRTSADVCAHLVELGLTLTPTDVVTSAQAAAARLRDALGAGASILGVGGPGVPLALEQAELNVVTSAETAAGAKVDGVLQSYGKNVAWTDLAEIAHAVNGGALWVASNADMTLPTERGIAPGNGSLVRVVSAAVSVDPIVVGKPETPLYELSASVLGTEISRTLAIGDRIDTDIEGANRAGMDALLVMTGVTTLAGLWATPQESRPRFLATDLRALSEPYLEPVVEGSGTAFTGVCGDARARVDATGEFVIEGGTENEQIRAATAAIWKCLDEGVTLDPAELYSSWAVQHSVEDRRAG